MKIRNKVSMHKCAASLRRTGLCGSRAVALLGALAFCVYGPGAASGQITGVQIIGLAQGSGTETNVNLAVGGPNDVLQAELVFQPGGSVGWHIHPGPVVVVIKSGTL